MNYKLHCESFIPTLDWIFLLIIFSFLSICGQNQIHVTEQGVEMCSLLRTHRKQTIQSNLFIIFSEAFLILTVVYRSYFGLTENIKKCLSSSQNFPHVCTWCNSYCLYILSVQVTLVNRRFTCLYLTAVMQRWCCYIITSHVDDINSLTVIRKPTSYKVSVLD